MCFVKSFGWYENHESVFIAMEYFPFGDLQNYLSLPLAEKEVQQITFQVLEGLSFMHDNGFAHRDLKPTVSLGFYPHDHNFTYILHHLITPENYRTFS
jgi:serine/threonine protein kinase